ncbi:MAG: hypothetical protein KYX62_00630 [Pseudomonadota bacterium]|nr:hypothetical protein [Pseudomonadota bacterium]
MSESLKVAHAFMAFILGWYLPGFVFSYLYGDFFRLYYNDSVGAGLIHLVWLVFFIFLYYAFVLLLSKVNRVHFFYIDKRLVRAFVFGVVFVFFILSIYFFLNYSSKFRHTNRLSDSPFWVSIIWALKPFLMVVLLGMYALLIQGVKLGLYSRTLQFLMLVGFSLTITSSTQALIPIIIITMMVFPVLLRVRFNDMSLSVSFFIGALVVFSVFCALFVGVGNKIGYATLWELGVSGGGEEIYDFLPRLIPRLSTSYASFVYWVNTWYTEGAVSFDLMSSVHVTTSSRFCLLFSSDCLGADVIDTVNRFNYLNVFVNHAERAGASPGILSSIFLFGNPFLGCIVISVYLAMLSVVFSRAIEHERLRTSFYLVLVPFFVFSLLESPLNIMYLLDPVFILLFFYISWFLFVDSGSVYAKTPC